MALSGGSLNEDANGWDLRTGVSGPPVFLVYQACRHLGVARNSPHVHRNSVPRSNFEGCGPRFLRADTPGFLLADHPDVRTGPIDGPDTDPGTPPAGRLGLCRVPAFNHYPT